MQTHVEGEAATVAVCYRESARGREEQVGGGKEMGPSHVKHRHGPCGDSGDISEKPSSGTSRTRDCVLGRGTPTEVPFPLGTRGVITSVCFQLPG